MLPNTSRQFGMAPSAELESLIRRLTADRGVRCAANNICVSARFPNAGAISCRVGVGDLEFE